MSSKIEDKITDSQFVSDEIRKQAEDYLQREKAKQIQQDLAADFKPASSTTKEKEKEKCTDACSKCGKENSVNASKGGYFCVDCIKKMSYNSILDVYSEV